jgi:hypothetical protein
MAEFSFQKDFQKERLRASIPDEVRAAMREVVFWSDNSGCSEDLTVTSLEAVERLERLLREYPE